MSQPDVSRTRDEELVASLREAANDAALQIGLAWNLLDEAADRIEELSRALREKDVALEACLPTLVEESKYHVEAYAALEVVRRALSAGGQ